MIEMIRAELFKLRKRRMTWILLIVLAAFFFALLGSVFLAAWLEFVRRMKEAQPDDYRRLTLFIDAFFGWLPGVRRSREKS